MQSKKYKKALISESLNRVHKDAFRFYPKALLKTIGNRNGITAPSKSWANT